MYGEDICSIRTKESLLKSNNDSGLEVEIASFITIPVSKSDNGKVLICEVIHPALTESLISSLTLAVHYPPMIKRIISFPSVGLILEDENVSLTCEVESNPDSSIIWYKLDSHLKQIGYGKNFLIQNAQRQDSGIYQCQAENIYGLSTPTSKTIVVQCKLIVIYIHSS